MTREDVWLFTGEAGQEDKPLTRSIHSGGAISTFMTLALALGSSWMPAFAQEQEEAALEDAGDDLDALLNMADQDVTQLDRVRVTAPALDVEVSTVSRQTSTVGRSPAAVFVITNDMIRRSGVRTIPEALRMAPGVHVAKIDSSKWAISIRGFSGRFANKLLVQIDGRTVYTPLFAGVFWDVQDMLLEDVERIEVIRGPGATVWGPNAVNGVINIISKAAADTQGAYANAGAGSEERGFVSARLGASPTKSLSYRVYGKVFDRDRGYHPNNGAHDDWRMGRLGGRMDWTPSCCDKITVQGDLYEGYTGRRNIYAAPIPPSFSTIIDDDANVAGGNVLMRWTRTLDKDREWSLQAYYDRTQRSYGQTPFREFRDTVDVDFQYRFRPWENHTVISGLGYRNSRDRIRNSFPISLFPLSRADDLFSYFIQDEIALVDDVLYLTLGSKFNHSDYTPFEYQPTARLVWLPTERHSVWAAVSRAVRMPSRADDDIQVLAVPRTIPGLFPTIVGNRDLESEDLLAFEAGFRAQVTDTFSWDWAFFYNRYHDLITSRIGAPTLANIPPVVNIVPLTLVNAGDAESFGCEVTASYQARENWQLYTSFSFLDIQDDSGNVTDTDSARNVAYFQSSWDIGCDWELDLIWRYVDALPIVNVQSYNTMDVRLGWTPTPEFELSVVGRNLLDGQHPEFSDDAVTGNVATEVQREVYGMMTWRY